MRSVNSAFWLRLQQSNVEITELIELTVVNGATYRWTMANAPVVSSGNTYDPFPGRVTQGVEESTDLGVGNAAFLVANTGDFTGYLSGNIMDNAGLVVRRVFSDTPDLGTMVSFRGKLSEISYTRMAVNGQTRNIFNGVAGQFPYYTFQDRCAWRFGDAGTCGVDRDTIATSKFINASSSNAILLMCNSGSLSSVADGYYDRGRVRILSGANSGHIRTIRSHSGDMLILSHALPTTVASGSIRLEPGCRKRVVDDCTSKYNNVTRAMAFPWLPRIEGAAWTG
jgi:uncharacterized phage protein (TIGR02218 family)